MNDHQFIPDAKSISGDVWVKYILKANELGELLRWNVFFASPRNSPNRSNLDLTPTFSVNKIVRARKRNDLEAFCTGTLSNRYDILSDLDKSTISHDDRKTIAQADVSDISLFDIRRRTLRVEKQSTPGLLGIYIVDKNSSPRNYDATAKTGKVPMKAPNDILGITSFFPASSSVELAANYVTLDTTRLRTIAEIEEEDLDVLIAEAEELDTQNANG